MNPLIELKRTTSVFFIAFGLACFAQAAQAVSPPPDGGYPGGNTAEGQSALFSLTTGGYNTGNGWNSLHTLSSGSFNTGIGAATLFANTGDQNTATGAAALFSNSTGAFNTANGALALLSNTTGNYNTAGGYHALYNNTTGLQNTAVGDAALYHNTTSSNNTAIGNVALLNTTGHGNTGVGDNALLFNTTGNNNIALGALAGNGVTTANNVICIGTDGNDVDNSCYIGNIFNATSSGGTAVFVNMNGRLGTSTSSSRFKENIKPMIHSSETLFLLKPVTFRYKKGVDPEGSECKTQFGLVAEDVESVNPDLVVHDKEGKPYSVRYDQVNAMLLNEFLKEHKAFVEEHRTVEELKKQVAVLTAGLQKVSAQIELKKSAPQTVLNNQ